MTACIFPKQWIGLQHYFSLAAGDHKSECRDEWHAANCEQRLTLGFNDANSSGLEIEFDAFKT